MTLKNSNFCHFKPICSGIIPIQLRYCEYIRNKLNFPRFLVLIRLKLDGNYWKTRLYLPQLNGSFLATSLTLNSCFDVNSRLIEIQSESWIRNPSLRNVDSRRENSKIAILRSDFCETKTIEIIVKRWFWWSLSRRNPSAKM